MEWSDQPDFALLARYRESRGETEFAELVRRYRGLVICTAKRILMNESDAEDAAQAAFVALALKTPHLCEGQSLGPWLHTVTVRAALDLRKAALRRLSRQGDFAQPASWIVEASEEGNLDVELEKLPKKLSAALLAHYLEGWSIEELARREGCAPSTISMRLNRGRNQLRKRFKGSASLASLSSLASASAEHGADNVSSAAVLKAVKQAVAGAHAANPEISHVALTARRALCPALSNVFLPAAVFVGAGVLLALAGAMAFPGFAASADNSRRAGVSSDHFLADSASAGKRTEGIAVRALVFSLPDTDALAFLKKNDPAGNPGLALEALEALGRKVGETAVVVASGQRGAIRQGGLSFEVEAVLSPDGKAVDITAGVSAGSVKTMGTCLAAPGRYSLLAIGGGDSDSVDLVFVGVDVAK